MVSQLVMCPQIHSNLAIMNIMQDNNKLKSLKLMDIIIKIIRRDILSRDLDRVNTEIILEFKSLELMIRSVFIVIRVEHK